MPPPGYEPDPGHGQLLPNPGPFLASDFAQWFFLFWAGLLVVVVAIPWCLKKAVKDRDYLPGLALLGGFITSLGEPVFDLVGHLRWAENVWGPAFTIFGVDIPLLIPPCYGLFMGLEAYWVYLIIQRRVDVRGFLTMFAAIGVSDAIMEYPGVLLGIYEYYGTQPFEFYKFPFYWSFTNGVAICTIGVMIHFVWPLVKDDPWKRLAILPLGIIGTQVGEFGSGFPVFLAINADIPTWLQWCIGSLALVISVVWIRILAQIVGAPDHAVEWTFWGLFKSRFMLPAQRETYLASTGNGASVPIGGAAGPVDAVRVSTEGRAVDAE